ncbi:hypothetical protein [Nocardioides alcanivorans]|uniref:hypothetical protein n=1 Tax=Nocardioides alcanivorans TaxID=2897352 RepID=UPI001F4064E3|nr:hypothetical protein [Nocardioides alcanivorans]
MDYIEAETLAPLSRPLRDFVLEATVLAELSADVAAQVTGRDDAGDLLEEVLTSGLFLERLPGEDGTPRYRWHRLFAQACQGVLARIEPERKSRLHRRAGDVLRHSSPADAVRHHVAAGEPRRALDVLSRIWPALVVRGDAPTVKHLIALLPADVQDEPVVLLIDACTSRLLGDTSGAQRLRSQAKGVLGAARRRSSDAERAASVVADLVVEDDPDGLLTVCDAAAEFLDGDVSLRAFDPPARHAVVFMLGWTELRVRRRPRRARAALITAAGAAQSTGDRGLVFLSRAALGLAAAFAGEFIEAEEHLRALEG